MPVQNYHVNLQEKAAMYEQIKIRQQKIVDYTEKARYYKLKELPEYEAGLIVENKALILCGSLLRAYTFVRGLWRKRAEMEFGTIRRSEADSESLRIETENKNFVITKSYSETENEWYFTFDVTYAETGDAQFRTQYYLEGAIADFTYVSFKWIMRNMNLFPYPFKKEWSDYFARGANNRIFYTCSGHIYFSQAYQETEFDRLSEVDRDIRRDIIERGRTPETVISRYERIVKAMHWEFIEPTKKFADIIIPQGGHNKKAIKMLQMSIGYFLNK